MPQRGAWAYTLNYRCNNSTGSQYGTHLVDWCRQAEQIMVRAPMRRPFTSAASRPTMRWLACALPRIRRLRDAH